VKLIELQEEDLSQNVPPGLSGLGKALLLMRPACQAFQLTAARFGDLWQIVAEDGPPLSAAWLELCSDFHLAPRREQWIRQLRRARFGRLRQLLPVTLRSPVEHPELPPGAVLQGLGISSWHSLSELKGQGRTFCLRPPQQALLWLTDDCTESQWQQAQLALLQPGCLIAEFPSLQADSLWQLHYAADEAGYIRPRSSTRLAERSLLDWAASQSSPIEKPPASLRSQQRSDTTSQVLSPSEEQGLTLLRQHQTN
jgi:hypothetical protein